MSFKALFEARWILAFLAAVWIICILLLPWGAVLVGIFILYTLYFFRDPVRVPPADSSLLVAPADGLIVGVEEVIEQEFSKQPQKRISVFLSIFDVHINRSPIAGEVLHSEHKPGLFLDARNPDSSRLNETRSWMIKGDGITVVVRQITGAIARRIVAWSQVGDRLERGERFGLIRFGSRTELFLPLDAEVLVKVGDKVRGGETPVAKWTKK